MEEKKAQKELASFLIVEPEASKRLVIVNMLRGMGYEHLEEAADGAAAFNLLKRRPIDCIISAWEMPQMNGLSLLKVVGADDELYTIPFFIVIRSIDRETVMTAGKHGASGILVEPIKESMLAEKIDGILGAHPDADTAKAEDLFKKAKQYKEAKKYSKALQIYRDILQINDDAEVYYNIGYIKTAQKKYDEAIVAFRKAVMIDNLHGRAYKMMGNVYIETGEKDEAEKCFEKAGEIFLERHMDKEAEESFMAVLKINPNTINIYNHLGIIYRRQHNPKQAIKLYRMAIASDDSDENIFFNLGRALMENKEIDEAKKVFEQALIMNPDFKEAKRMLEAIKVGF